jgi:DNA-binding CsgD family transcriptional regulator
MTSLIQSDHRSVLEATDKHEFKQHVVRFAQALGFRTVTALTVIDRPSAEPEFLCVDNGPAEYDDIANDPAKGRADPVMQHCKRSNLPLIWDRSTYVNAGQTAKWEEQARFGFRCGIALALHLPAGRHFMLAVDRDEPLPNDPAEVTRMAAALQLYAVHAHEASTRVLVPSDRSSESPALTSRERETLQWTMEGKTAWEVGRILGIAEDTVIRHAHNAARKLGCSGKHHAVVKALRLGLIK